MQLFEKRKFSNERSLLTEKVSYYAIIGCDDKNYRPTFYKGVIKTTFKKRYANHKKYSNVEKARTIQSYVQNTGS